MPATMPSPLLNDTHTYAALCCVALQVCVQRVQRCVDGAYRGAAVDADAEVRVQPQQLLNVWPHNVITFNEPAHPTRQSVQYESLQLGSQGVQ